MIITVTMNPAIDKTAELDYMVQGGLNRLKNVIIDVGGKGINVSKTIKELGGETIASGFIGGSGGVLIKKVLMDLGIQTDFIEIENEVRTNLKIVEADGHITELNEPGPTVTKDDLERLTNKLLSYANEEALFILAGSIPKGIDHSVYQALTQKLKSKGAKVFVDADGELFHKAVEAYPDIIKPNRHELEEYFHINYQADENELIKMGKKLLEKGIAIVAISLGEMGAIFLTKDKVLRCLGLKIETHSTVGAGDAMVAALAYGLHQGLIMEEWAKWGIAASAGAVTTKGTKPPKLELVNELIQKVQVRLL